MEDLIEIIFYPSIVILVHFTAHADSSPPNPLSPRNKEGGREGGRRKEEKDRRKEGRKEGRKKGRKERRKEGKKEGRKELPSVICSSHTE